MKRVQDDENDGSKDEESGSEGPSEAEGGPSTEKRGRAVAGPPMDLSTRLRRGLRTYRFAISIAVTIVGLALFFIGLFAWTPLGSPSGPLAGLEQPLLGPDGNTGATGPDWTLAMLPGGGLMALIGGYLVGVYVIARRRFEHLMKTKSKAEFLRNVTEAEDLLWDLTPEDEIRLVRKKLELKIRG